MKNKIAIPLLTAAMVMMSCQENKPTLAPDKCAEVIFQMHRADAIISARGLNDSYLNDDSLSYYNDVFAKTGVTRKEFMETIEWYVNHPELYKDLYDKVIMKVDQFEEDEKIRFQVAAIKDTNDVWNMKSDWHLPLDGDTNPVSYEIPTEKHGTYTLSFDAKYYEDDGTENPRATLMMVYDDGSMDQNSTWGIEKDGKEHNIKVILTSDKSKKLTKLRGWVLDQSDNTKHKHIDCYNITLKYRAD